MKTKRRKLLVLLVIAIVIMSYAGTALAYDLHHEGTSKYSYTSGAHVDQQYENTLNCVYGEKNGYYVRCLAVEDVSGYPTVSSTDEIFDNGAELYVYEHPEEARNVKIKIVNYSEGVGFSIKTHGHWDLNA